MDEQNPVISTVFVGQCYGRPSFFLTGAMAFNGRYVCVGTDMGYAVLGYPDLQALANEMVCEYDEEGGFPVYCDAMQMCQETVLMFNSGKRCRLPDEWRVFLVRVGSGEIEKTVGLPKGYWRVVNGLEGSEVVVYDWRRERGLAKFDIKSENMVWTRSGFGLLSSVHYDHWSKSLLVLGRRGLLAEVSINDGIARNIVGLPQSTTIKWTAAAHLSDKLYAIGGFDRATRHYVLAIVDDRTGGIRVETRSYLDFFRENGDRCDRVLDRYAGKENPYYPNKDPDSQLDTDIDNVVAIFAGKDGAVWSVVGGTGMGWDHLSDISGCALLRTRSDAFGGWAHVTLSDFSGCASVLQLPNRELLIQCENKVMHVR